MLHFSPHYLSYNVDGTNRLGELRLLFDVEHARCYGNKVSFLLSSTVALSTASKWNYVYKWTEDVAVLYGYAAKCIISWTVNPCMQRSIAVKSGKVITTLPLYATAGIYIAWHSASSLCRTVVYKYLELAMSIFFVTLVYSAIWTVICNQHVLTSWFWELDYNMLACGRSHALHCMLLIQVHHCCQVRSGATGPYICHQKEFQKLLPRAFSQHHLLGSLKDWENEDWMALEWWL